MRRNRKQEAALSRIYEKKRNETRAALEKALITITNDLGADLTERSLYQAAHRSRATLNRYPDIKARLAILRDERRQAAPSSGRDEESRELSVLARLKLVQQDRDALAQRVAILSIALQDLERRNASLVNLLRRSHVAVPIELVVDNAGTSPSNGAACGVPAPRG